MEAPIDVSEPPSGEQGDKMLASRLTHDLLVREHLRAGLGG